MAEERVQRRLAAILAADVAGYSRLMGEDEEGTLAALTAHRTEMIEPCIAEHRGRVVKTTGDGLLAEFASVVDAVRCAVAFQDRIAVRNAGLAEDKRIQFRIGVNLGDVIVQDDDVYGDGVNVAARLEGLSEPGGIIVSGGVHDQVRRKVDVGFDDLGERKVKNITEPVRAFAIRLAADGPTPTKAPLALPDKPSIAVLPFANMSGDPDQEYFSDGISEDIITALSCIRWFFVTARNSSFSYKGRSPDVREVARELGVRYVLEGSVRKSANRVRVTAQLIDGQTGNHIWANRYDRDLEDIFAVQDEITQTVVGAIEPELSRFEQERARLVPPENMDAWDCYQRGQWHLNRITPEDIAQAKSLFRNAIDLDPNFGSAYAGTSACFFYEFIMGVTSRSEAARSVMEAAKKAVELDANDAAALAELGRAYHLNAMQVESIPILEAAIALNPSLVQGHYLLGATLAFSGRADEAIPSLETALRLSPRDPWTAHFMARMSEAHLFAGRLDEAVAWGQRARRHPGPWAWTVRLGLTSALGHLGRLEDARNALEEMKEKRPGVSLGFVREHLPMADETYREVLLGGLRIAGVPE